MDAAVVNTLLLFVVAGVFVTHVDCFPGRVRLPPLNKDLDGEQGLLALEALQTVNDILVRLDGIRNELSELAGSLQQGVNGGPPPPPPPPGQHHTTPPQSYQSSHHGDHDHDYGWNPDYYYDESGDSAANGKIPAFTLKKKAIGDGFKTMLQQLKESLIGGELNKN